MAASMSTSCPRRYSVGELLTLRSTLPEVNCTIEKIDNKHPDIASVFRVPGEIHADPKQSSSQYQALGDATNRLKVSKFGNRHTEGSPRESEEQEIPSSRLANSRQGQWQLRQRDSSQRSSEPHPAPSGISSQQIENFQRFYRAVVSPTHVRVTAGGRIVPNTRAPAPPKFDWNPDNCLFESRRPFSDVEVNTQPGQPAQHSLLPKTPKPFPGSLLPAAHLSNFKLNPQSASNSPGTMAAPNPSGLNGQIKASLENDQSAKSATHSLQPTNCQQPIKISPPSQFDHSRPFVYNGQVVYPVPAGFQPPANAIPVPVTVLGDPNLQHQVPTTGNFMAPPYGMPAAMPLMMPPSPLGHIPVMLPNGGLHFEGGVPMAPYVPQCIPGLVPLSELTKSQLHGLRNQVKHIDNQLANNKHQVDEVFLQRQRSELMIFVNKMEAMLHVQLGQEANQTSLTHLDGKAETHISHGVAETLRKFGITGGSESNKSNLTHSPASFNEEPSKKVSKTHSQEKALPVPLFVPVSQRPVTHTQSEDTQPTRSSVESVQSTRSEPAIKSRLTVAAAKAPPFQPRAHIMAHFSDLEKGKNVARQTSSEHSAVPNVTSFPVQGTPQYDALGNRLVASFSPGWAHSMPQSGVDHAVPLHSYATHASYTGQGTQSASLYPTSTIHTPPSTNETASKPYLVGSLPHGVHHNDGSRAGFIYSRPLTEDEIRARHLYWGDAPRSVLKGSGLPKFDGKDFYPPSPTKGLTKHSTASNPHLSPTTVPLPAFDKLFTESQMDGYRTPPQTRENSSAQNLVPTPTMAFLNSDIIGFQSPSPRPAKYKFENKLPPHWSYSQTEESSQKQLAQPASNKSANPDFSTLFTSPTAPQRSISSPNVRGGASQPTTPQNKAFSDMDESKEDKSESLDYWGPLKAKAGSNSCETASKDTVETQSNASTVQIRLSANETASAPPKLAGLVERQATFYPGDSSTLFLQNMLRNTAAATMAAPAAPGAISSATAKGYLPSLRGTATASLVPAILNPLTTMEREYENGVVKTDIIKISADGNLEVSTEGMAPLIAANFLPEDRPINRDRPRRPVRASVDSLGAEGYLRYITQKAEDDKRIVEEGWNSKTTGTGPVMGSDW